jgi:minor histocompatibility antigen H13
MWNSIWSLRRSLAAKWRVVIWDGSKKPILKHHFWLGDFAGFVIGILVVGAYALGGKHWLLTNMMGTGFAYGAMQVCANQPSSSLYLLYPLNSFS